VIRAGVIDDHAQARAALNRSIAIDSRTKIRASL
jgi:hypothetical protein